MIDRFFQYIIYIYFKLLLQMSVKQILQNSM